MVLNMSIFWKKSVSLICITLCVTLFVSQTLWSASYQDTGANHEVIILFDLNSSDEWHASGLLSADVLCQLVEGLPLEWHLGLITFELDIVNSIAPGADTRASVHTVLSQPEYIHTYRYPALFSDSALNHTILFLSNNELAVLESDSALIANIMIDELISDGLLVHSLNLSDELTQTEPEYSAGRDLSAPEFSFVPQALPGQSLVQNFSVYLSGEPNDTRRVLIASENVVERVFVSVGGYAAEVEFGRRFGVVEVLETSYELVQVDFSSTGQTSVSIASAQESDALNLANNGLYTRLWLSGLAEDSLFLSSFFDGALVPLFAHGTAPQLGLNLAADIPALPQEPLLQVPTAAAPMTPVVVTIDLPQPAEIPADDDNDEDYDENDDDTPAAVQADPPAATDPPPSAAEPHISDETTPADDYEVPSGFNSSAIWIAAVIILLILILFFAGRKMQDKKPQTTRGSAAKKKHAKKAKEQKTASGKTAPAPIPVPVKQPEKPEEMFVFAGKFDIYLEHTDTQPGAFALFKLGKRKQASLEKILSKCSNINISGDLANTKDILFAADSSGELKVVNNSDFRVCVKEDQLQLNESRILSQGDNIHIFFEGERKLVLSPRFLYQMPKGGL